MKKFIFSGGEVHVSVDTPVSETLRLVKYIENSDDIMELLLMTDAYRRLGVKEIELILPYVPYARQDRVMNKGESLAIKVFCDIINSQNYKCVYILDPHSEVTPALLNNCISINQDVILKNYNSFIFKENLDDNVLICPDAGARKKIHQVSKETGVKNIVYFDKIRNTETGKITGTKITQSPDDWDTKSHHVIIDDICDGGYTFTEIAKILKENNDVKEISLYVTHAILSKGITPFNGLIDKIFTVNCWLTDEQILESNLKNKTQIIKLDIKQATNIDF